MMIGMSQPEYYELEAAYCTPHINVVSVVYIFKSILPFYDMLYYYFEGGCAQ